MAPALRQVFNDSPDDDQLSKVFGQRPRLTVLTLSIGCIAAGLAIEALLPEFGFKAIVNWPALVVGGVFALLFRRYLFSDSHAKEADFPWLAASLIPAGFMLVVITAVTLLSDGEVGFVEDAPLWTTIGMPAELLARSSGVAAALAIAVAALSYSRRWLNALLELAVNLALFLLVLAIARFVMIDIGIVDILLSTFFRVVFHITFPSWVGDVADQISYASLLLAFYFAVIGATWTACRQQFSELLASGEVNVLASIKTLIDPPSEKKLEKQRRKAAKKAARIARKKSKSS